MKNTTLGAGEPIDLFIERLVAEKGLVLPDPEVRAQVVLDLRERLENIVNASLIEHLPPEKLEAFEALLDTKASDEAVQAFCSEAIPDLSEVVAGALLRFRDVYLQR